MYNVETVLMSRHIGDQFSLGERFLYLPQHILDSRHDSLVATSHPQGLDPLHLLKGASVHFPLGSHGLHNPGKRHCRLLTLLVDVVVIST